MACTADSYEICNACPVAFAVVMGRKYMFRVLLMEKIENLCIIHGNGHAVA